MPRRKLYLSLDNSQQIISILIKLLLIYWDFKGEKTSVIWVGKVSTHHFFNSVESTCFCALIQGFGLCTFLDYSLFIHHQFLTYSPNCLKFLLDKTCWKSKVPSILNSFAQQQFQQDLDIIFHSFASLTLLSPLICITFKPSP